MPTSVRHHDEAPTTTTLGAQTLAPMLAIARRTQAALADATFSNISDALSTAQQAVETARSATNKVVEREALASSSESGLASALESFSERNQRVMRDLAAFTQMRAQAYVQLPGRVAACRTPQDLVSLQMSFWQKVLNDYADASRGMMAVWSGAAIASEPNADGATSPSDQQPADRADRPSSLREASQAVQAASVAQQDGKRGPDGRRAA